MYYPVGIYMFKVNTNTRTRCEICSKLTIKTPEQCRNFSLLLFLAEYKIFLQRDKNNLQKQNTCPDEDQSSFHLENYSNWIGKLTKSEQQ